MDNFDEVKIDNSKDNKSKNSIKAIKISYSPNQAKELFYERNHTIPNTEEAQDGNRLINNSEIKKIINVIIKVIK